MELSTELKTHVALVKKSTGDKVALPITKQKFDDIVVASNHKKTHIAIDGAMYFTRDITVEKMTEDYRNKVSDDKVRHYTVDQTEGYLKGNRDIFVKRFIQYEMLLGSGEKDKIIDSWYGYHYDRGIQRVTVDQIDYDFKDTLDVKALSGKMAM